MSRRQRASQRHDLSYYNEGLQEGMSVLKNMLVKLDDVIERGEKKKQRLEERYELVKQQIEKLQNSLKEKEKRKQTLDSAIRECETAYGKLCDNLKSLLHTIEGEKSNVHAREQLI
jgi:chromosome segregation ATPase